MKKSHDNDKQMERNRKLQLQTSLYNIKQKSFLVLMMKTIDYKISLIPSRKQCNKLIGITNFYVKGFFNEDQEQEDDDFFKLYCSNIKNYLKKNLIDSTVKKYADYKIIELMIDYLHFNDIKIVETYQKNTKITIASVVRIQKIGFNKIIVEKLTEILNTLKLKENEKEILKKIERGFLREIEIGEIGFLYYNHHIKPILESNKHHYGLKSFVI